MVARQGDQAAELIDQVLAGLQALANDPQAGRKLFRTALQEATEDYRKRNLTKDRRRVSETKAAVLTDAGLTGKQLLAKQTVIRTPREEAGELKERGRGRRRIWRRFVKASGVAVDTLLNATKIGHALKELLDLAGVVLDS